jgi:ribonucleotide monophosphatase NagD (HAD superfamily)
MRRFGVALDVDGVLLKGTHVIPQATTALQILKSENIPTIFLTNGIKVIMSPTFYYLDMILE